MPRRAGVGVGIAYRLASGFEKVVFEVGMWDGVGGGEGEGEEGEG